MAWTPWDDPSLAHAAATGRRLGVVDLHVDTILQQRLFGYQLQRRHEAGRPGQPLFWHADIPRMLDAGYASAAMGIHWYPFEKPKAIVEACRQIDYLDQICATHGINRAFGTSAWADALESDAPSLTLIPGVEGAHILGGEVSNIDRLVERGVAYLTLAHFSANKAASPGMGRGANERDGLTPWGMDLVRRLNDAGIVVDVSHVNQPGVLDACRTTRAPLMATHSGVSSIHRHTRLLCDDAIDGIAATGGLIGVIFAPHFLSGRMHASSEVVADHLDWIKERVGVQHVAIGSDFDGWLPRIPSDMKDCRDIVKLVDRLQQRGWTDSDLFALLRGNVARVVRAVATAKAA